VRLVPVASPVDVRGLAVSGGYRESDQSWREILLEMPKTVQPKAKSTLHDNWMAETKADAETAFDLFLETFRARFPQEGQVGLGAYMHQSMTSSKRVTNVGLRPARTFSGSSSKS
jgi:hypothetical protein